MVNTNLSTAHMYTDVGKLMGSTCKLTWSACTPWHVLHSRAQPAKVILPDDTAAPLPPLHMRVEPCTLMLAWGSLPCTNEQLDVQIL